MKSVMQHKFSEIPPVEIPRSSFDRSHGIKTAFDAGWLIPILVDEALPGDTFNVNLTALARLATPIKPLMDNMFLETFFFSIPYRLVWDNWEKFNGAQDDPGDSTDYTIPQITAVSSVVENSLYDYMGIPAGFPVSINALPVRAYHLVWNEWFRDQNLQDSAYLTKDDANTGYSQYTLQRRGKRHDYFTSCLPWPQKGDAVELPLGSTAPLQTTGTGEPTFDYNDETGKRIGLGDQTSFVYANLESQTTADTGYYLSWNDPALEVDLSTATAATINQIRQAFQVQKLLERDARGGTRYNEVIKSHFGVTHPDQSWRSEYLGGGSQMISVTPVPQQGQTDTTPQANLAGVGTVQVKGHGFTKSFTEHCIILGLVNVRADLTYQQGLNRMWSRLTRYDFYWPSLAHIGEQAVYNREIYYQGDFGGANVDGDVFGYQERYAEYRYKPSLITGKMRSNNAGTLDVWHLSQDFSVLPVLGSTFIQDDPPIDRVIAVPTEPHFLFDGYFSMRCARPMPLYGVPGLIDHF